MNYSHVFPSGGTYYVTIPFGVSVATLKCWGGGGAGASYWGVISTATAGGGGGAFAQSDIIVNHGDILTILVGKGGTTTYTYDGNVSGDDTRIFHNGIDVCMADHGIGVLTSGTTGGNGGLSTNCIGDIKYNGGRGSNRVDATSAGGGGGAAGDTGDGNNAVNSTGGSSKLNFGGAGGDGNVINSGPGYNGYSYGGGGGGCVNNDLPYHQNGGNGADGAAIITYDQITNILMNMITSF